VCDVAMEFSRCGRPELEEHSPSKLNSVTPRSHSKRSLRGDGTNIEVDVVLGEPWIRTSFDIVIGRHNERSSCDNR
jgi:hypothetical protein